MDFGSTLTHNTNNVDDIDDGFGLVSQTPTSQQQQGFSFVDEPTQNGGDIDPFGLGALPPTTPTQQQQTNSFFPIDQSSVSPKNQQLQSQQSQQQQQQQQQQQFTPVVTTAKQQWDAKKAKQLAARKEQQQKALEQNITAGKKELADFRTKRDTHTNKLKSTNRAEEKETQTALQATLENGTEFEKVAKYCDLKPKHDPKIATQPGNTERMRTLLIDLKNDKTETPNKAFF